MRAATCLFAVVATVSFGRSSLGQPTELPTRELPSTGSAGPRIPVEMNGRTEMMSAEATGASSTPAPVSLEQPIDPERYICGPGDIFDLNFWGQQNFRLRIAVDLEGRTFISKVGFVSVSGKTLSAVRADIKKKVRGTYPGLQADLTLVSPRSFQVHVVANVKTPGTYVSQPVERVATLLARAGGLAANASKRQITIKRGSGQTINVDLLLYELTGDTALNPYVLDGDVITVPFAQNVIEVAGAVRRPGKYELIKTNDLSELLQLAGGFDSGVARSLPIRIVRRNDKQQDTTQQLSFPNEGAPNAALHDQDRVLVPGTADVERTILVLGAVIGADQVDKATTGRRLPFVEGDSVSSLIQRAGGLTTSGDLRRAYIQRPRKNNTPEVVPVDLEALLVARDLHADRKIALGDVIVVPRMQYSVLVEGAVGRAGLYDYNPLFGISEYIAHAGGRTRTARDLDEVKLIDPAGQTHGFSASLKPNPGDTILVPERNFSRSETVQIIIAGAGLLLSGVAITIAATR